MGIYDIGIYMHRDLNDLHVACGQYLIKYLMSAWNEDNFELFATEFIIYNFNSDSKS